MYNLNSNPTRYQTLSSLVANFSKIAFLRYNPRATAALRNINTTYDQYIALALAYHKDELYRPKELSCVGSWSQIVRLPLHANPSVAVADQVEGFKVLHHQVQGFKVLQQA